MTTGYPLLNQLLADVEAIPYPHIADMPATYWEETGNRLADGLHRFLKHDLLPLLDIYAPRVRTEAVTDLLIPQGCAPYLSEFRLHPPREYYIESGTVDPVLSPTNSELLLSTGMELSFILFKGEDTRYGKVYTELSMAFRICGDHERQALEALVREHEQILAVLLADSGLRCDPPGGYRKHDPLQKLLAYFESNETDNGVAIGRNLRYNTPTYDIDKRFILLLLLYDALLGYAWPRTDHTRLANNHDAMERIRLAY